MNYQRLIQNHLLKRSCLSILLYPFSVVYGSFQKQRRKIMLPRAWHAPCKVISIGNITAGGSGKTPLTIALAKMLKHEGYRVAVSHRGYKGDFEHIPTLISNQAKVLFPPEMAGDEAHLIASSLPGIPVVAGSNRRIAIKLLLKLFPATQVVIMDDAFQHVKVHRDLDIVSFSAEMGLGNGWVLPAGYLREALDAIDGRNIAVIYSKLPAINTAVLEKLLRKRTEQVFHSHAVVSGWKDAEGEIHGLEEIRGRSVALISGIANPASFEALVKEQGLCFSHHHQHPDHYHFENKPCVQELQLDPAEILLCTEKDLGKLQRHHELKSRLAALVLDYCIEAPCAFMGALHKVTKITD